jgi:hypothetical protein
MENVDELISETSFILSRPITLPARATTVVYNVFLLSEIYHLGDDPRVRRLWKEFHEAYGSKEDELLPGLVRYTSRLARAPGELIYEEIHLLLSDLDVIHALQAMGYSVDESLLRQMEADVRDRFLAQRKAVRLAAEDKAKDWNRGFWWYSENLRPPRSRSE